MKKLKTVLIFLLVISLILPINVNAVANTQKEEIIYVSASPNGKRKGVYVVNAYDIKEKTTIVDFGEYEKITNITNTNEIKKINDEIKVQADKGKFFYQGDNPNKELPWTIELKFIHNGKEIDAKNIAGKSGDISIKGKIKINKKANPVFSKYFLGQLSINIDSKKAIVKEAKDSALGYNGSIQILNYTILPEKELNFEIKLDSKSFEMQPFTFAAVPFNMNFEMPDTSIITDSLGQLENGIRELSNGTREVRNGSSELNSNIKLLNDGFLKLYNGLEATKLGQDKLSYGNEKLNEGLKKYQGGIGEMISQMSTLETGMEELKNGLIKLKDGSDTLNKGVVQYADGIKKYTGGIDELQKGHLEFTNGIEKMGTESSQLIEGGNQLVAGSEKIYEGFAIFDKIKITDKFDLEDFKKLEKIVDKILAFWDITEKMVNELNSEDILKILQNTKELVENVIKGLEKIDSNKIDELIEKLKEKLKDDPDSEKIIAEINEMVEALNTAKSELQKIINLIDLFTASDQNFDAFMSIFEQYKAIINEKLKPLKKALEEYNPEDAYNKIKQLEGFRSEYKKFHDGLVDYANGTKKLVNGINNELLEGSKKIDSGLSQLAENGQALNSGIIGINAGTYGIYDGLNQIVSRLDFGDFSRVQELKTGIDLITDNHSKLVSGESQLSSGLEKLLGGFGQYSNGFSKYINGMNQFNNGVIQLENGTSEMSSSTAGMTEKAKKQIDEAMAAFKKDGFKLESFVSKKNTNIKHLQFAYVSDVIKVKEEKIEEKKVESKSFWEKVWDIIRFWD